MKSVVAALLIITAADTPAHAVAAYGGFPDISTTAKASEYVLVPSWNWIEAGAGPDAQKAAFIFYRQKMIAPGVAASNARRPDPVARRLHLAPACLPATHTRS